MPWFMKNNTPFKWWQPLTWRLRCVFIRLILPMINIKKWFKQLWTRRLNPMNPIRNSIEQFSRRSFFVYDVYFYCSVFNNESNRMDLIWNLELGYKEHWQGIMGGLWLKPYWHLLTLCILKDAAIITAGMASTL